MLSKRLKSIRDEKFGGSNVKFAKSLKVSEGSVRGWIAGRHAPGSDVIEKICRAAGVSTQWLLAGEGPRVATAAATGPMELKLVEPRAAWFRGPRERIDAYFPIPLVAGRVAAGSPSTVSEHDVEDWIPTIYHRDWCPHPDQTICVRVQGDSMIPTIPDGGLVAIDMAQREPARLAGRIVAVKRDGGVTIKRLFQTDDKLWVARPDNVESNEIFVYAPDLIAEMVLGKVVWWWGRQ
jgi:phage repressor protein C with HTH and peptisase S24 domain